MKNLTGLLIVVLVSLMYSCRDKRYQNAENVKHLSGSQEDKRDCCKKPEKSASSQITCPDCGYAKTETLPTEICQLTYTCNNCRAILHPKEGDCCVFCSYGDHNCPSKQQY